MTLVGMCWQVIQGRLWLNIWTHASIIRHTFRAAVVGLHFSRGSIALDLRTLRSTVHPSFVQMSSEEIGFLHIYSCLVENLNVDSFVCVFSGDYRILSWLQHWHLPSLKAGYRKVGWFIIFQSLMLIQLHHRIMHQEISALQPLNSSLTTDYYFILVARSTQS